SSLTLPSPIVIYTLSLHDALPICLYAPQLEKLFALFAREQVLVLKYETFRADPFSVIDQVFDFIGVGRRSGLKNKQRNVGSYSRDRKSTRLNSSHLGISYAVFCLK